MKHSHRVKIETVQKSEKKKAGISIPLFIHFLECPMIMAA